MEEEYKIIEDFKYVEMQWYCVKPKVIIANPDFLLTIIIKYPLKTFKEIYPDIRDRFKLLIL